MSSSRKLKLKEGATLPYPQGADKMADSDINRFRSDLLVWYDKNRRVLPWRAGTGEVADPYHVWLSEIMLQQTVVAAVIPYFLKFLAKWPGVHDLANAEQDEVMSAWAGLGYYTRARNLYKCAQIISRDSKGVFPDQQKELKALPGIGDYTSAAIAAIAFGKPATVVDGNVERVVARYFAEEAPLPDSKKLLKQYAAILSEGRADRPGDFAQAMMDLGATVCTPKSPKCAICPVRTACKGYESGMAAGLPRRTSKKEKPRKVGYIYWIRNIKGQVLFERRPERGLLGGMLGLPTSEWVIVQENMEPVHLDFVRNKKNNFCLDRNLKVFHSFTHFDLELNGLILNDYSSDLPENEPCFWVEERDVFNLGLPTLFKKFVNLMLHDEGSKGTG